MTLFWLILLADTLTMIMMIIVVIRRPRVSSLLGAITGVSAFAAALHQVASADANLLSLPLAFLLVWMLVFLMRGTEWGEGRPRRSTRDGRGQ
jgi:hypothetical protein